MSDESCYTCANRRFGWMDDHGWDTCDEVCQIGDIGTLLFCIHGLSPEQVTAKLKEMSCERWSGK